MLVQYVKRAPHHPRCELRAGISSWDANEQSIKFTWFDKRGRACRGGEFPLTALVDAVEFAIDMDELSDADIGRLRRKVRR